MSCPSCGALYRSGFSCCPSDGAPLVSYESDPIVGKTIADNYVVDDCIGEGGMGRVYRAHHARLERRKFAVKILLGELAASEEMRRRFEQEAQAASRLHHANVVPVLDFGQQGGLLYIVMEYVRGRTLSSIIDEGPMHERRVLELSRKLCLGLAHAHEQGLVHRDFKPENVIVVDADDGEVPRILDFGLAIIADPSEDATRLTSAGMIMGTPAYISPEQSSGRDVDHRTDLFALGIAMYEMLAGTLPFSGTVMEVLASNAVREPPPISERTPGVTVSPQLEQIVFKLLAKKPDERYPTARKVVDALDAMRRMRGSVVPQDSDFPGPRAPIEDVEAYAKSKTLATPSPVGGSAMLRAEAEAETEAETGAETGAAAAAKPRAETTQAVSHGTGRGWVIGLAAVAVAAVAAVVVMSMRGGSGGEKKSSPVAAHQPSRPAAKVGDDKPPVTPQPKPSMAKTDPTTKTEPDSDQKPTEPKTEPTTEPTTKPAPESKTPTVEPKPRHRPARRHRPTPRHRTPTVTTKEPDTEVAPVTRDPILPKTTSVVPPPVTPPKTHPKPTPKPKLDARASIAGFSARGSLSSGRVRTAVNRVAGAFRSCYRQAARLAKKDASGRVSVKFRIGESRRAVGISVGSAPLPGLSSCIKSAIRNVRTRRAPDVGSVHVSFHVRYTPLKP